MIFPANAEPVADDEEDVGSEVFRLGRKRVKDEDWEPKDAFIARRKSQPAPCSSCGCGRRILNRTKNSGCVV